MSLRDEKMDTRYYECECGDFDHVLRASYFTDEPEELYVEVHLRQKPLLKRLWGALLYVLGKRSRYGDFDEFLWGEKTALSFRDFVDEFVRARKEYWDKKEQERV